MCINHVWASSCGDYTNGANMGSSGMINSPGYYYDNGEIIICPSGYYCPGSGCARRCDYYTRGKYTESDVGADQKSDCYQYFSCENVKGDEVQCKGYNYDNNDNQITPLAQVTDPHNIKCSKNGVGETWDPYKNADNSDLIFDNLLHFEYEYDDITGLPKFNCADSECDHEVDWWTGKTCYFNVRRCTKFPRITPGQAPDEETTCNNYSSEFNYSDTKDMDKLREDPLAPDWFDGYAVFGGDYSCPNNQGAAWQLDGCNICSTDGTPTTNMTPEGSEVSVDIYGTIVSDLGILDSSDGPTYQFLPTTNTQDGCTAFTTFNTDGTAEDACPSGEYKGPHYSNGYTTDMAVCFVKQTYMNVNRGNGNIIKACFCNQLIFSVPTGYRIIKCNPGYYADAIYDVPQNENVWKQAHPGCACPKNDGDFSVCKCNPVPAGYFRTCEAWGPDQDSTARATAAACLISNWGNDSRYQCPNIGQTTSIAASNVSMCRYGETKLVDEAGYWIMPNDASEYEGWEPAYLDVPSWN